MTVSDILRFQFGDRRAIEKVASSRAAFFTGIGLVLITTIPRNYDQIWIGEWPLRWAFGSLVFSLVSGTLLFIIAYWMGTSFAIQRCKSRRASVHHEWVSFMGLFWMTAPLAWVYAIPVERMVYPLTAVHWNAILLGGVALWRVLLMARILAVTCQWNFGRALLWVGLAASMEVMLVTIMSSVMAMNVAASMGGMRNSPEEEAIRGVAGIAFSISACGLLVSGLGVIANGWAGEARGLPKVEADRIPIVALLCAALVWIGIAVVPQQEVRRNAKLDGLVERKEYSRAVELMSRLQPADFSPSRQLPPLAYEVSVFEELPAMLAEVDESTAPWVQEHLLERLEIMLSHLDHRTGRSHYFDPPDKGELRQSLNSIRAGRLWLNDHEQLFVAALGDEDSETDGEVDADGTR